MHRTFVSSVETLKYNVFVNTENIHMPAALKYAYNNAS